MVIPCSAGSTPRSDDVAPRSEAVLLRSDSTSLPSAMAHPLRNRLLRARGTRLGSSGGLCFLSGARLARAAVRSLGRATTRAAPNRTQRLRRRLVGVHEKRQ